MASRLAQSDGTTRLATYFPLSLSWMTLQKFEVVAGGHAQPHIDEAQKSAADAAETFVRSALSYPQFPHPDPHHRC
ncbi:hypothetical protein COMA2_240024 [Candidatus Nitrospira nitrificans]|uniref:Uncharacterized protein n=1 Tax=Candidatus Nitrospira nitrificans TaxID=1742973 RepID=A0A0S4LN88_9BACT|nr:hypothetical protein COMA2_240024 [Candidatus Nitrospira nitrificans]